MQNLIMIYLLVFVILISGCTHAPANDITEVSGSQENAASELAPDSKPLQKTVECPFGRVDDPYPGECGRYTDINKDGICDLSQ